MEETQLKKKKKKQFMKKKIAALYLVVFVVLGHGDVRTLQICIHLVINIVVQKIQV